MADGEDPLQPGYRTMREFAEDDRPRERLLRSGAETLSDAELLAIILGSGTAGENVMDLSRRILDEQGRLPGLVRTTAAALRRTRGPGPAKAAQIAAAIELGRRVQRIDPEERPVLLTAEAVFNYTHGRFLGKAQEELYVLALDTRGRLLGAAVPVRGSVNAIHLRPVEVFREAIVLNAVSVVFAHNHPSGDPRPSPQDVTMTKQLIAVGDLLDITVLDHVVVGEGRYVSMAREGYAFSAERRRRE